MLLFSVTFVLENIESDLRIEGGLFLHSSFQVYMPFLATYQWTVCIHGLTADSNPYEIYTSYFFTTEG